MVYCLLILYSEVPFHCREDVGTGLVISALSYSNAVLEKFWERFIQEVDANSIMYDLKHEDIISDGDVKTISQNTEARQNNQFLHGQLMAKCDKESLMKVCDIIIAVNGHPRMKRLGQDMKRMLQGEYSGVF